VQAGYGAPKSANLGADALRTRGRQHRGRRQGEAAANLAGSETPGMHGHIVDGTWETLPLAWASTVRSARHTQVGYGRDAWV